MDETRRAAERLTGDWDKTYPSVPHSATVDAVLLDTARVAKAYLAEHPADDGEPLSKTNIPPWYDEEVESALSAALDSLAETPLAAVETWGRLRHLCNALGVELKERL